MRDHARCVVQQEHIGPYFISTLFLGVSDILSDLRRRMGIKAGPPLVFETIAFHDGMIVLQSRVATWDEAEAEHTQAVQAVTKALKN